MSGVNANAVKRSNALNGYGPNLTYCEGRCFASYFGPAERVTLASTGCSSTSLTRARKFVLPKRRGPSPEFMETGYLTVTGVATGSVGPGVVGDEVQSGSRYKDTLPVVERAYGPRWGQPRPLGRRLHPRRRLTASATPERNSP